MERRVPYPTLVVLLELVPAAEHGSQHVVLEGERAARDSDKLLPADVEVDQVRCLGVLVRNEGRLGLPLGPGGENGDEGQALSGKRAGVNAALVTV